MQDSTQNQSNQGIPSPGTTDNNIDSGFPESVPQASPSDFFPPPAPQPITTSNRKIISTFLGMLLLVGGLGVGIVLVEQPQLLGQKAAPIVSYACGANQCDTPGFSCMQDNGKCVGTSPLCTCVYPTPVPPVAGGCFLPGTKVHTPNGDKNIEDVAINTNVYSFNDQTKGINTSPVSNIYKVERDFYFIITTGSANVSVTAEHPFYIGNGKYTEASKLMVNDIVYLINNNQMSPTLITNIQKVNKPTVAYNLTAEGDHTFFANNYAVHNKTTRASTWSGSGCQPYEYRVTLWGVPLDKLEVCQTCQKGLRWVPYCKSSAARQAAANASCGKWPTYTADGKLVDPSLIRCKYDVGTGATDINDYQYTTDVYLDISSTVKKRTSCDTFKPGGMTAKGSCFAKPN